MESVMFFFSNGYACAILKRRKEGFLMYRQKSGLSPMDYALGYLTGRDRTEQEMRAFLEKKEFGEADIDATVDRLKELRLIDDCAYAERYIRTRLASKPVSKAHLKRQLTEHQIDPDRIEEALLHLPDETEQENADLIAKKFYRQFLSLEPQQRKVRVLRRLQSRGFGYDVCSRAYAAAEAESEEDPS